jgi:plastocyanin
MRRMNRTSISILLAGSLAFGFACSSGTTPNDGGTDSGTDGAAAINGCTTFTDMTADGGVITGPSGALPSQYVPPCVHVKVGQSVTWNVDLANHPLVPTAGVGTTPNPITATSTGTTVTFAFPAAGTFAYNCGIHSTTMLGAVEVTP